MVVSNPSELERSNNVQNGDDQIYVGQLIRIDVAEGKRNEKSRFDYYVKLHP